MKIYSSGGCGDALIVAMKIEHLRLWTNAQIDYWGHYEKHECHRGPCATIVKHFVPAGDCWIRDKPEDAAKQLTESIGNSAKYINTKIIDFPHPYLPNRIENNYHLSTELWDKENYVVVQITAGRLYDNTRRSVSRNVVDQLHKRFPEKTMVLLGPEQAIIDFDYPVINLTGKTESILDVFSCINNCGLFVGQDGVMSYYAAMLSKPTIISYHIPNLLKHYWNGHWSLHCAALIGGNTLENLPESVIFEMVK